MSLYFNQYQHKAKETAIYEDRMYPIVSLVVEAAELCDLFVKPYMRGDNLGCSPDRSTIISEAGDVLWNLSALLAEEGITLDEVAEANLKKLDDRQKRGVLQGNGGNR